MLFDPESRLRDKIHPDKIRQHFQELTLRSPIFRIEIGDSGVLNLD
jgi:hypothetical protein